MKNPPQVRMLAAAAGLALASSLVLACTAESRPEESDGASPIETSEPSESPQTEEGTGETGPTDPDLEAGGEFMAPEDVSGDPVEGGVATSGRLTDIRVAEHEGFTRVVLDLTSEGMPAWTVSVDSLPSGVFGSVHFVDVDLPARIAEAANTGEYVVGHNKLQVIENPDPLHSSGQSVHISHLYDDALHDGFRVIEMKDPTRLVIDLRHT